MAEKNTVDVLIGGKVIKLSGYESEEYLQQVAAYMDRKQTELKELQGYNHLSQEKRNILLALNIADDYFKVRRRADEFDGDIDHKDDEIYALKQKIVGLEKSMEQQKEEAASERQKTDEKTEAAEKSAQTKIAALEKELNVAKANAEKAKEDAAKAKEEKQKAERQAKEAEEKRQQAEKQAKAAEEKQKTAEENAKAAEEKRKTAEENAKAAEQSGAQGYRNYQQGHQQSFRPAPKRPQDNAQQTLWQQDGEPYGS